MQTDADTTPAAKRRTADRRQGKAAPGIGTERRKSERRSGSDRRGTPRV